MWAWKVWSSVQHWNEGSRGASHGCRRPMCAALFAGQGLQGGESGCPLLWLPESTDFEGNCFLVKAQGQEVLGP